MKKIAIALLSLLVLFAFSACNNETNSSYSITDFAGLVEFASGEHGTLGVIDAEDPIALTSQVVLSEGLTLDGNGKTLTIVTPTSGASVGDKAALLVTGDNVRIENLTVEGGRTGNKADAENAWNSGEYGIKIYDSTGVVLDNVTVKGMQAGVLVSSSVATMNGTITVGENIWGGIEVSKGTNAGLDASSLTVNGTIESSNTEVPVLWIDGREDGNTVTGSGVDVLTKIDAPTGYTNQTWYLTTDQTPGSGSWPTTTIEG